MPHLDSGCLKYDIGLQEESNSMRDDFYVRSISTSPSGPHPPPDCPHSYRHIARRAENVA